MSEDMIMINVVNSASKRKDEQLRQEQEKHRRWEIARKMWLRKKLTGVIRALLWILAGLVAVVLMLGNQLAPWLAIGAL